MATYRIALLGDGIIGSWGDCRELHTELKRLYPRTDFEIYNNGRHGSRVGYGLHRVAKGWERDGVRVPPLSYDDPHIAIVESFAYTQRADGPEGLTEYRDALRSIWDELAATTRARRVFAIAPPPIRDKYGEGVLELINTSRTLRARMADDIQLYLDEARRIAHDEGWPMADVCAEVQKRVKAGEAPRRFVDGSDNIHPSRYGFVAMAAVLVQTIDEFRIIEEPKE